MYKGIEFLLYETKTEKDNNLNQFVRVILFQYSFFSCFDAFFLPINENKS